MSFFLLTMQRYGEIQKRQWIWTQKTPKTALFLTEIKKLCAYTALFLVFYYWFYSSTHVPSLAFQMIT